MTLNGSTEHRYLAPYTVPATAFDTVSLRATDEKLSQFLLRSRKWLAVAVLLAAPAALWFSNRYQTRQYLFAGSLLVLQNPTAARFLGTPDLHQYAVMAKSDEMLLSIVDKLPIETKISDLASRITAKPSRASIDIQLEWTDEFQAPQVLDEVLNGLASYSKSYRDINLAVFETDLKSELNAAMERDRESRDSWHDFAKSKAASSIEDQVQEIESEIRDTAKSISAAESRRTTYRQLIKDIETQINAPLDDLRNAHIKSETGDVASSQQLQLLLSNEIRTLKERAIAEAELQTAASELERKQRLSSRGLLPVSQVRSLEMQVRKLEVSLNDDAQTKALRSELNTVASRLADPQFQARDAQRSKLSVTLNQAKLQESLEDGEVKFRQSHLQVLQGELAQLVRRVPEGLAIQDAKLLSSKRIDDIQRELEGIAQVKRTHGHSLSVFSAAKPAAQPIKSNRKAIFASSFGVVALMVLIPGLGFEMHRLRQSRGAAIADRYQLPIVGRLHHRPKAQSPELVETAKLIALRLDNIRISSSTVVLITELGTRSTPVCLVEAIAHACGRRHKRTLVVQLSKLGDAKQPVADNAFVKYLRGEIELEKVREVLQTSLLSTTPFTTITSDVDHDNLDWQQTSQFTELLKAADDIFDVILVSGSTCRNRYEFHALAGLADTNILTCLARDPDIEVDSLMEEIVEFNIPMLGIVIRD